jgi:hypothetical protein
VTTGGRGYVWVWHLTAWNPGSYGYTFNVGGVQCASATLNVSGTAPTPTPTFTPVPTGCYGDEAMSFNPATPGLGQPVIIEVTSARPSTSVNLTGPWGPAFQGSRGGGKGTIWAWRVSPQQPGQYSYNFTISGNLCAVGTFTVGLARR